MPSDQNLDQVVVIGYGTARKGDITGSISSVSGKDLKAVPAASLSQALTGRAAGVRSGHCFQLSRWWHQHPHPRRQFHTGGNEPLYVVDGYPLYNENGPAINPNDIESMEILKDASATAIYGSRGANGVIIITTKRGKAGRNQIQLETYYGIQKVRKKIPMLNAEQLATLINEGVANVNKDNLGNPGYPKPLPFTEEQVKGLWCGNRLAGCHLP